MKTTLKGLATPWEGGVEGGGGGGGAQGGWDGGELQNGLFKLLKELASA